MRTLILAAVLATLLGTVGHAVLSHITPTSAQIQADGNPPTDGFGWD